MSLNVISLLIVFINTHKTIIIMSIKYINNNTIAGIMQSSVHLYIKLLRLYIEDNHLQDEPLQQVLDCLEIEAQDNNKTDIEYLVKKYIQYV